MAHVCHSSAGWMMTSNVSLSPLLPNNLGPFPDSKSISPRICLGRTFSWERLSTEEKSTPRTPWPRGEIAQDGSNETNI